MSSFTFTLSSPEDLYQLALQHYNEYNRDLLNEGKALICALLAYHIRDWIVMDQFPHLEKQNQIGDELAKLSARLACDSLSIIGDIANGLKHFKVVKSSRVISDTEKHEGPFAMEFEDIFDTSQLMITMKDGPERSFARELTIVMDMWATQFPAVK